MTIEILLRQTEQLYNNNGRAPILTARTYVKRALGKHGYDVEVTLSDITFEVENQQSVCGDGSAYYEWRDYINRDDTHSKKDSNVLLTDSESGGCGAVGGKVCTVPGGYIEKTHNYSETESGDVAGNAHAVLHEVGHNLGQAHDHNNEKEGAQHRGKGWNDPATVLGFDVSRWFGGYWHRTPSVAGNDTVNYCGVEIPERRFDEEMYHQYYTDCAANSFEIM